MRQVQAPGARMSSQRITARKLDDARRVARRFLVGYLPLLYGRGSARSVDAATHGFRLRVARLRAAVTPAERRRHPRVISLSAVGRAPAIVTATALVSDGGVTTYALQITVHRGASPAGASVLDSFCWPLLMGGRVGEGIADGRSAEVGVGCRGEDRRDPASSFASG
jgi:hypothetical protein